MFSTVSIAVSIEWSWLLYRCMPLRPTGCTFGACSSSQPASIVDVAPCSARRRPGTPSASAPRSRPRPSPASTRPSCSSSRLPCSIRSSSGIVHSSSPSKTKYSRPRQVRPSLTRYGDQEPKFWMRPTLHARGRGCRSSCRGSRTPRARPARRSGSRGSAASSAAASTSAGGRRVHRLEQLRRSASTRSRRVHGYSVRAPSACSAIDRDRPAVARARIVDDRGVHARPWRPARSTSSSRQRSHIIPGPYFGYWNSSISAGDRPSGCRLGSSALHDRVARATGS